MILHFSDNGKLYYSHLFEPIKTLDIYDVFLFTKEFQTE